jgi:REP element-mobilizing transposase RayT
MERWLDAGHGSCILRDPANAAIIGEALRHFDGLRIASLAWIVMPNHVHVLFVQHAGWTPKQMIHSWKSFSAQQINARRGTSGSMWMQDYFDRIVRDEKHFSNCVRYIRRNPAKANLRASEYLHYESPLAQSIE